ncbi:MAG: hypothetical protein V5A64_07255 [Candidatus Thermoplasmatota archaeon]
MQRKTRYFAFLASMILLVIASILTADWSMSVPTLFGLGGIGLTFWFVMEALGPICRSMTQAHVSNVGKHSIRADDIYDIPWGRKVITQTATDSDNSFEEIKEKSVLMTFAFTGGIHVTKFWTDEGTIEDPVCIYPTLFKGQIQNNFLCYSNLFRFDFSELPLSIQDILVKDFGDRVDPQKTPFYFGLTSHMDESNTEKNLALMLSLKEDNTELTTLKDRLKRSYEQMKREKKANEKQIVYGKQMEPVEED